MVDVPENMQQQVPAVLSDLGANCADNCRDSTVYVFRDVHAATFGSASVQFIDRVHNDSEAG